MVDTLGIHGESVTQAVRGAVFLGDAETLIGKVDLKKFELTAEKVALTASGSESAKTFYNLGHMSNDTLPEFSLDGGDATNLSTWLEASFRTSYDETTGKVTFSSVQGDKTTLKTIYNAVDMPDSVGIAFSLVKAPVAKSVLILWQDTNTGERSALLLPNLDLAFNNLPSLSTDKFTEYGMEGTIKTSKKLPKDAAGKYCSVAIFDTADFKAA